MIAGNEVVICGINFSWFLSQEKKKQGACECLVFAKLFGPLHFMLHFRSENAFQSVIRTDIGPLSLSVILDCVTRQECRTSTEEKKGTFAT